jgi:hypothetical protein
VEATSYYASRSARDPEWRDAQIAAALDRDRKRREADPDGVREERRLATRRTRQRQRAHGLTFHELATSAAIAHSEAGPATLARILREEIARGRVEYHSTSRRFVLNVLNGGLSEDVKRALLDLGL